MGAEKKGRPYKKRIRSCLMLNHDRYREFARKLEPDKRLQIIDFLVEYSYLEANHGKVEAEKWLSKSKPEDLLQSMVLSILKESVDSGIQTHHQRARDHDEEAEPPNLLEHDATCCNMQTKGSEVKSERNGSELSPVNTPLIAVISQMDTSHIGHDAEYLRYHAMMDSFHRAGLKPTRRDLTALLKKYSDEELMYAIGESSNAGVEEMKYVQTILNRLAKHRP